MTVKLKHRDHISYISFNKPPMNLLTLDDMRDLIEAHQKADAHGETRVIITQSEVAGIFSNGLDPNYVLGLTNTQRVDVFQGVADLFYALVHLQKPHLAVIEGPAMAGGAILALTADYRYFDADLGRISFSEPKVGLPIPHAVCRAIEAVVSPRYVRDVIMMASNMDAATAQTVGLADGVASKAQLQEMVLKQAGRLARLSPAVLRETKSGLRAEVRAAAVDFSRDLGVFASFVGDAFLGEGLRAIVENRHPNFVR